MSERGDDDEYKDLFNSVDRICSACRCDHSVRVTCCASHSNPARFCHSFIKFYHNGDSIATNSHTWSGHSSAWSDRCSFSGCLEYLQRSPSDRIDQFL